jgi:predicted NUDIX family NTP pyrophosphohydrolase
MPIRASPKSQSTGLLLFRYRDDATQVLRGHPGQAIIEEWAKGKKHQIWLANKATEGN